jgi:hypothetical protein
VSTTEKKGLLYETLQLPETREIGLDEDVYQIRKVVVDVIVASLGGVFPQFDEIHDERFRCIEWDVAREFPPSRSIKTRTSTAIWVSEKAEVSRHDDLADVKQTQCLRAGRRR